MWLLSWTSVSQLRSCGIHLNKILHEMVGKLFDTLCLRTLHVELKSHLPESVGLNLDAYKPGAILLPIWWMYWNWLMPNCFRGFPSIMLHLNCTRYQHETQALGKSSFKWHQIKIPKFPVQSYWMVWCKLRLLFLIDRSISFLAATKQLYEWSCLSVRPSHLFHYVPLIVSSWNFQELLPMTKVMSMQNVKVRGQRSRSQRSKTNLTISRL